MPRTDRKAQLSKWCPTQCDSFRPCTAGHGAIVNANMKKYIAPIGLMLGTLLLGFYSLTRPPPVAPNANASKTPLDPEISERYAAMAEHYAKEAAQDENAGSSDKKAGSI